MADELVSGAPGGGSVSSGGSGGGSPTPAAPATPASAPVTSTPAATPAAVAPVTPEAAPVKGPGEPDNQFLERFHKWNDAQPKPTGDEKPVEPVKPAAVAEPVKPAEPVKAAEPEKPAEPAKIEPAAVSDELDKLGPLPAAKVAEAFTKDPELEAKLAAAGIEKDDLFGALREAAVATQFRQEFPDIETAKFAKGAAITMHQMDLAATELKPGDLKSTAEFVNKVLMPLSYVLDENGEPKMRDVRRTDGSTYQVPETDGTVQTMLNNFRDVAIEQLVADADTLSKRENPQHKELGERLLAAVHEIQSFIKGSDETAAADLPEHLKEEAARIQAEKTSLATSRQQEADQRYETFKTDVQKDTDEALNKQINGWLEGSSLAVSDTDSQQAKDAKAFMREKVVSDIRSGLFQQFNRDQLFLAEQEQLGRRGYSAATKAALVNHYTRSANAVLKAIAEPILQKAGYERVRQSAARAAKIDAQIKVSQMEPRGATSPAMPRAPQVDEKAIMAESRTELMKELRRDPNPGEMIERFRQKLAAQQIPA